MNVRCERKIDELLVNSARAHGALRYIALRIWPLAVPTGVTDEAAIKEFARRLYRGAPRSRRQGCCVY